MKKNRLLIFIALGLVFLSCEKDEEVLSSSLSPTDGDGDQVAELGDIEVEQFIYTGLNDIYLYKADVPVLDDAYFASSSERDVFLSESESPEALFEDLKSNQDRFSFISDDYNELEKSFKGVNSSTAGMEFGLGMISGTNNVFGFLQYIIPGTSAAEAGLDRGTVFTEVNGSKMTTTNYMSLLEESSLTINIGSIENGRIVMTDKTVSLNHAEYTENPVHLTKILDVEGQKVGYLMYNSFTADFDDELNAAFGEFKANGVSELVLDLRYNGGGSVESAVDLASMITGQFEGEIFMKEQWNEAYQKELEAQNPENLINRFNPQIRTQEAINSLNLSRVFVLTTQSTASASELVINGLEPYIDVVQIGENTTGKFQASVTLYDSPNFRKEGANKNHTYALQPLVFKSANASGKSDYVNGLTPDLHISEDLNNLGTLGDPSEPMLQAAINYLTGKAQVSKTAAAKKAEANFTRIGESGMTDPAFQRMYIEELPFSF